MSDQHNNSSTVYYVLALLILVAVGVYGMAKYKLLNDQKAAVVDNELTASALNATLKKEKDAYSVFAEEQTPLQVQLGKNIAAVLPPDENYTDLTRLFDSFFKANDKSNNPIFQSSLRFGKSQPVAQMFEISSLPISMNIEGTRDNFFKFIDYVNKSGNLEEGMRLMEINSIQLNFPDGGEIIDDEKQLINFTLDMTAYHQTPKVER